MLIVVILRDVMQSAVIISVMPSAVMLSCIMVIPSVVMLTIVMQKLVC
jgi:hypothetical protein